MTHDRIFDFVGIAALLVFVLAVRWWRRRNPPVVLVDIKGEGPYRAELSDGSVYVSGGGICWYESPSYRDADRSMDRWLERQVRARDVRRMVEKAKLS